MTDDKIAEIRARHEAGAPGQMPIVALMQADADRDFLLAEIERLRIGLHRISLASQNSMSSKDECGRIARETLEDKS